MKRIGFILMILTPVWLFSQKHTKINKYTVGIEIDIGHSFPNFDKEQDRWKATFYPTYGFNLLFTNRINAAWSADLSIGLTGYVLINKGPVDSYILDFASPTLAPGITYNFPNRNRLESFIKLSGGLQMGYQGMFVDQFDSYGVFVESTNTFYSFIRPEIGIRKHAKRNMKGTRDKLAHEFGTFFRYNFSRMGKATFKEPDFEVTLEPSGNIIGAYFKILFPVSPTRVKIKQGRTKEQDFTN